MAHRKGCHSDPLLVLTLALSLAAGAAPPVLARSDRVVRVVIAADDEFRSGDDWEERARQALVVAATPFHDFGIRFVVERVVGWVSDSSDFDLAALHDELSRKVDPAGADVVIGFTGDDPGDDEHHLVKLGNSDTPGRWAVVTGRAGQDLPLVLRHELGHVFGVPHVRSVPSVMNEDVRAERSRFDRMSAAVIGNNAGLEFGSPDPFAGCRIERLLAIYDEMAEDGNDVADLVEQVGESFRRRNQADGARRAWRRALELNPALAGARLGLGMIAMEERRFAEAVTLFEAVRGSDVTIPGLDMNLGIAYSELGQNVAARKAYERALEADPRDASAMNNLALLCIEAGDSRRALELFRSAVDLNPGFMEALNNLGMLYDRLNRPDEAIRTFESALDVNETAVTHRNLAGVLLRQGRRAEARRHIEASLRLDPAQAGASELQSLSRELR